MSNLIKHPYHLVEISPWPLFGSIGAMGLTTGIVVWFHLKLMALFYLSFLLTLLVIQQWWRDVSREGSFQGIHTLIVETGLRWGIILFIVSEVMFFFSFFWAFFHSSLSTFCYITRCHILSKSEKMHFVTQFTWGSFWDYCEWKVPKIQSPTTIICTISYIFVSLWVWNSKFVGTRFIALKKILERVQNTTKWFVHHVHGSKIDA